MYSSPAENRVSHANSLAASSSFSVQASLGAGSLLPVIFLADKPAGAIFGNGTAQASGKVYSRRFWRNSRQRVRSIGIARWWTMLRCVRPVGAQKRGQILRSGVNWEANTIGSPMPTASSWPLRSQARTATMLRSCYPCSTASHELKGSGARHALGLSTYKATAPRTPNPTARRSKKGIKPVLAKHRTAHGSGLGKTRWFIERTLAWLHQFRKLKTREEKHPSTHEALMLIACSVICYRFIKG